MQGIAFMFSSGDNGDELPNTGLKQADYPASDPYVTAVGGTVRRHRPDRHVRASRPAGAPTSTACPDGTRWIRVGLPVRRGRRHSALFNRPSYQTASCRAARPGRAVPDVAMDGDPTTGMLVGETQTFPDGATTTSSASAAPACPRRCSPA